MRNTVWMDTPFGPLFLAEKDGFLTHLLFRNKKNGAAAREIGELLKDRALPPVAQTEEGKASSVPRIEEGKASSVPQPEEGELSPVLAEAIHQLEEYFVGTRREFSLPLLLEGTEFQKRVWAELQRIPYGETITYKELAARIGNPGACRAVGMANHNNPISVIVPCHRVIGADGSLTGYGGGLPIKKGLLQLEGVSVKEEASKNRRGLAGIK